MARGIQISAKPFQTIAHGRRIWRRTELELDAWNKRSLFDIQFELANDNRTVQFVGTNLKIPSVIWGNQIADVAQTLYNSVNQIHHDVELQFGLEGKSYFPIAKDLNAWQSRRVRSNYVGLPDWVQHRYLEVQPFQVGSPALLVIRDVSNAEKHKSGVSVRAEPISLRIGGEFTLEGIDHAEALIGISDRVRTFDIQQGADRSVLFEVDMPARVLDLGTLRVEESLRLVPRVIHGTDAIELRQFDRIIEDVEKLADHLSGESLVAQNIWLSNNRNSFGL